ncbi:hypothetical protein K5549_010733 [Capra hircus]|nr:hypothetical protein K5549_010733 [Capra hircus]
MDGSFSVKPLKQKQIVDRVSYLLQEIYGIENKNNQETKPSDEENSDNSNECVVCLSDLRDTLILPCRHLCLCNSCADTLRYQASNCPICRLPFRALLQIRAVRKKPGALSPISFSPVLAQSMDHDEHSSADGIPPGYEPISLLEALNGLRAVPPAVPPAAPTAPLYEEITYSGVSDGLSQASCPLAGIDRMVESSLQKGKPRSKSPDSTLRSPSSPIHEEDDSEALPAPGGAGLALSSSPESFMTETVDETSSLKQGSRVPSIENVLQDGSPEPCGRSQPGAPADVYLPAPGPGACSGNALARLLCVNLSACAWVCSYHTPPPRLHLSPPCRRLCLECAAPLSALLTELPSFSSSGSTGARLLLRWFRGVSRYVTPSHEGRGAASPYGEVFSGALDFESRGF